MIKSLVAKALAKPLAKNDVLTRENAIARQDKLLKKLIHTAKNTAFGKNNAFDHINSYETYKWHVPLNDYEGLKPYIERARKAEPNILWPGKPLYWAKTSGTTSGAKYIPISKESMPKHIRAARNALLNYASKSGNAKFFDGKMIFLQGSPELEEESGIPIGRLSGIVAHHIPAYLQKNRLPSWQTNCITDWEEKLDAIVQETKNQDLRLISGIPPWLIMYFEKLISQTQKPVGELFPNLTLIVTGGVNFEPYRNKITELLGRAIDVVQTFPASEGFFAYQDKLNSEDLLLLCDNGIFYEFVPLGEVGKENPKRLSLAEVKTNTDYALVLTTNAGLWSYEIGDVVQFTSLDPFRIIVSGRVKHYTSAFGEHVIAKEVESALKIANQAMHVQVNEFTLAPQVNPKEGLPYHEWFIEFSKAPENMETFAKILDDEMQKQNAYYMDLIQGKVLRPLKIVAVQKNAFNTYMESIGKLGGQNKLPRLSNDRKIADKLTHFLATK